MNHTAVQEQLAKVVESLDRVCPACLAAKTRDEWELLHQKRRRLCPA